MFIFGQLFLAAILFAFPLGYFFGIWWYTGSVVYLLIANVMTFYTGQKILKAQLKVISRDISNEAFKIRTGTKKIFSTNELHPYILGMIVVFAPCAIIILLMLLAGNCWLLKLFIEYSKKDPPSTPEDQVKLLWLKDLQDNGLFHTKL